MFNNTVNDIAVDSSDNIFCAGAFTTFNGTTGRSNFMKLLINGAEDAAFSANLGSGFNSPCSTVIVAKDGGIIVGGNFTSFNGTSTIKSLVKFNADGTLNTAF